MYKLEDNIFIPRKFIECPFQSVPTFLSVIANGNANNHRTRSTWYLRVNFRVILLHFLNGIFKLFETSERKLWLSVQHNKTSNKANANIAVMYIIPETLEPPAPKRKKQKLG